MNRIATPLWVLNAFMCAAGGRLGLALICWAFGVFAWCVGWGFLKERVEQESEEE